MQMKFLQVRGGGAIQSEDEALFPRDVSSNCLTQECKLNFPLTLWRNRKEGGTIGLIVGSFLDLFGGVYTDRAIASEKHEFAVR